MTHYFQGYTPTMQDGMLKPDGVTLNLDGLNRLQPFATVASTQRKQLKFGKKLHEFYTAPISKFWMHSVSGYNGSAGKMVYLCDVFHFLPEEKFVKVNLCESGNFVWKVTVNVSDSQKFMKKYLQNWIRLLLFLLRGDFKTQPPVDLRFHRVPGGCHCLEQ